MIENFRLSAMTACIIMSLTSCYHHAEDHNSTVEIFEKYSELQTVLGQDTSKLWIVNFWATTCPPCLKEMPHFKQLEKKFEDQNYSDRIDEIDPSWYGALPATLISKGKKRKFRMGIYHSYDALHDDVVEILGD